MSIYNQITLVDGSGSLLLSQGGYLRQVQVSNVNAMWRGAVQPAETGASGNEVRLWRAAVEPAYVAPAGGSPAFSMEIKHRNFGANRNRRGFR